MSEKQPSECERSNQTDEELLSEAVQGDGSALKRLFGRHQVWIYNLCFYMLHNRQDAEDATQEVLVKIATGLSGFAGTSSFRTWARRIAVNHALDCRRSRPEKVVTGFGCYADYLDHATDSDFATNQARSPEEALLVEEARTSCVMGMLLCLDRNQRVVFLLGEILETQDRVAAELLSITRDNFRQQLARAREQLSSFMQGRCGLVNSQNSCRCARKTQAFIKDGIVVPNRIQFARGHLQRIAAVANERTKQVEDLVDGVRTERYPLFDAPDVASKVISILNGEPWEAAPQLN